MNTLSNLVKDLHNQNSKPTDYFVVESYMHPGLKNRISALQVKADEIETAMLLAKNNRHHQSTLIELFVDGDLVASQDGIDGKWKK